MAVIAFKAFSIAAGGTPQPAVGTTTTQGVSPMAVGTSFKLTVTDGTVFLPNKYALIGKPSTGQEQLYVAAVNGNTITFIAQNGIVNSYPSSTIIRPSFLINSTFIQAIVGNSGAVYIGTQDNMVKSTYAFCVSSLYQVSAAQANAFQDTRWGAVNADDCATWWIDGTTNDKYLPSFGVV